MNATEPEWVDAAALADVQAKVKLVVRRQGRQILLIDTAGGVRACANRCPHQGFPLSEGVLTEGCVLTCNWHNWKFNLDDGRTLVGGDRLRTFPVRVEGDRVLVDLAPEDPAARRARILAGLERALDETDQERLVRESARLADLNGDAVAAVGAAIAWAAPRFEFGTTHAFAGAPDWLALHDANSTGSDEKLAAIGEILGHIADDARGAGPFPFPPGEAPWDEVKFLAAIEAEDEPRAAALIRGALRAGLTARDLAPSLFTAALAHYQDFGHSLIYAVKTVALIERIGPQTAELLLLALARSLIFARREDLLPEFRDYGERLAGWARAGPTPPPLQAVALRGGSPRTAMTTVAAWNGRHPRQEIFAVLVEAAAWALLHVDSAALTRTDGKIADNVGWLDFTHALTFAEAGREATAISPTLWPPVLLQLACFIGRNSAWLDPDIDVGAFAVGDPRGFVAQAKAGLFDHGRDGFIVSVHLLKTLMAAEALAGALPDSAAALYAAINRLINAPMKRRHVLRTARQMRAFVAEE
ncbi:MAG TPA: Rieske (2Fe-2S) protein [Caulobacteraceae bacterium]